MLSGTVRLALMGMPSWWWALMGRYIWIKVVIDHPATASRIQRISKAKPMIPAPNATAGSQSRCCSHLRGKHCSYWSRWTLARSARAASAFAHNGICQRAARDRELKLQPSSREPMQQTGRLWEMCNKNEQHIYHCSQTQLLQGSLALTLLCVRVCAHVVEWKAVWRGQLWTTGHFMPWSGHVLSKHLGAGEGWRVLAQEGISGRSSAGTEESEWRHKWVAAGAHGRSLSAWSRSWNTTFRANSGSEAAAALYLIVTAVSVQSGCWLSHSSTVTQLELCRASVAMAARCLAGTRPCFP